MVRKVKKGRIKSFKGKTMKRYGEVEVMDMVFPITTRSIAESSLMKYTPENELPVRMRPATKEEVEGMLKNHPKYNKKTIPLVQEYDTTHPTFIAENERENRLLPILQIVKHIDMDYEITEDDNGKKLKEPITLWEDMGIEHGNWTKVAEYFIDAENGLGLNEKDIETLYISIKELQGESVFTKIKKFEELTGRGMYEILEAVQKVGEEEDFAELYEDAEEVE